MASRSEYQSEGPPFGCPTVSRRGARSALLLLIDADRLIAPSGSGLALRRLLLAVLRRSGRDELVEQTPGHLCDLGHGPVEGRLVRPGRRVRSADLSHELQGRVAALFIGRGRLEVVQRDDVAA